MLSVLFLSACTIRKNPYALDLDFMYHCILDNHPGVYNEEDPEFRKNLQKFYDKAKAEIRNCKSDSESKKALSTFATCFRDPHLRLSWQNACKCKELEKISMAHIVNGIPWITLPTFSLSIQEEKEFEQLLIHITSFQTAQYIVFDLRGNRGGNSGYGTKIISALFGKAYAHQKWHAFTKEVYVDWRVSPENLDHISYLFMRSSDPYFKNLEHNLQASMVQKKKYYREYFYSPNCCDLKKDVIASPACKAKIILIIDTLNGSSALTFIDELKMMTENLILIGQKTSADRLYTEVRAVVFPSGLGHFVFPIKVFRNRHWRLDNQPYSPDIEYQNVHGSTSALQNFILTQIKEKKI